MKKYPINVFDLIDDPIRSVPVRSLSQEYWDKLSFSAQQLATITRIGSFQGKQALYGEKLSKLDVSFAWSVSLNHGAGGKSALVRDAIGRMTKPFSLSELQSECPGVSLPTIKRELSAMKNEGLAILQGRGRGAKWNKLDIGKKAT